MTLGIFMSLLNGIHFKRPLDIWFEFLPQLIFLLSLFGYMVVLIFIKWLNPWTTQTPPMLLNVMIDMFLKPYTVSDDDRVYNGQFGVQIVLLLIAFISVPIMLCVKPLRLRAMHKKQLQSRPESIGFQEGSDLINHHEKPAHPKPAAQHDSHGGGHGGEDGEDFDFGEVFVKQCIHTIEFVLGAISNTASYLRLWALSLAHAQLSEVFWNRVLLLTYSYGNFVLVFFGFAFWSGAPVAVLLIMESLSAFLHALRLHWVEFQNKFYHGDGQAFLPFSFERLLNPEED